MGLEAICFSNSDLNKGGFKTEDEAWDYAHSFDCDACKDAEHNACIAEWDVFDEDDEL